MDEREVLRFAQKIASRCSPSWLSEEEKRDAALLGVSRALASYKPGRLGISTWIYIKVRREIVNAAKEAAQKRAQNPDFFSPLSLDDCLVDPVNFEERIIFRVDLERTLEEVTDEKGRKIFSYFFEEGRQPEEIASLLELPEPYVCEQIQTIRQRLAERLEPW